MPEKIRTFPAKELIAWQKECGRNNLPWQSTEDPYLRWIAEIMLQQTQVEAVKPYYERFTARFPTLQAMAGATEDEILVEWEGLGYYSRARNAHKCAKAIVKDYLGDFPLEVEELTKLPGIGPSTAGAIVSAVTDKPEAIFDGNVKRVFSRFFAIEETYGSTFFNKLVLQYAKDSLPEKDGRAYSQGLMDLGSMVCVRVNPKCLACPVSWKCKAYSNGKVSEYPRKAQAKAKPTREAYWLIGLEKGKVFLQHREGKGIWKGLWSFPMTGEMPTNILEALPDVQHEFTHFKLVAKPFVVASSVLEGINGKWFDKDEILKVGLPSPVRPLVQHLLKRTS